ncbi:MAG: hypothetical protein AAF236_16670 [Verrucomicrobiota bacterium]
MNTLPPKPKVVTWFKVYAWVLAVIYLILILAGVFLALMPSLDFFDGEIPEADLAMMPILGGVYVVFGLLFLVAFVIGIFTDRQRGAWVYNLVLICIGMTSGCFIAASVPLLIFWLKPECKAYYGRD